MHLFFVIILEMVFWGAVTEWNCFKPAVMMLYLSGFLSGSSIAVMSVLYQHKEFDSECENEDV